MYQYIIVAAILLLAVGYASWRVYVNIRHANDPCYGCTLKDHCTKTDAKNHKDCTNMGASCCKK